MQLGRFRLAVNLSILFTELPLLERFAAARTAGFDAVELWWPFASAVPGDGEVDELLDAIGSAGVDLVSLNLFAGDMPAGDRGIASWPGRESEVRDNAAAVVEIARRTGCRRFNGLYGARRDGVTAGQQDELAVANLAAAAEALAAIGGVLLIESLTEGENGAYPLRTAADAAGVVERIGAGNVAVLLDTYHLTRNGDDLLGVIDSYAGRIGHVQIADSPGRGQPGTGGIDFVPVLEALAEHGYDGLLSCEYRPQGPSAGSFDWITTIGAA
ncbi:MAG TPA: TIM barrel protein [Mycobacteriales bacterium]|nr:TIM barrel protein [Mycobacteriales bacterium]